MGQLSIKWETENVSTFYKVLKILQSKMGRNPKGFDIDVSLPDKQRFEEACKEAGLTVEQINCEIDAANRGDILTYGIYPDKESMEEREAGR